MSRTFVRRLAAVALLAVLCFTLPAAAAAPRHTTKAPATVPSLWDEILSWVGLLGSPETAAHGRTDRTKAAIPTLPLWDGTTSQTTNSDGAQGMDPNGLH